MRVALIGLGAIGTALLEMSTRGEDDVRVVGALVRDSAKERRRTSSVTVIALADLMALRPEVVVECAGHAAVAAYVPSVLRAGIDVILLSGGALADDALLADIRAAASEGRSGLRLASGAIGGLDAIRAASRDGLRRVTHSVRKPASALVPATELAALTGERVLYRGSAREGVRMFPESANAITAVSLAGLGLDATQMAMIADPQATRNRHVVEAEGKFGSIRIEQENVPSEANPRTSLLTALSAYCALLDRAALVRVG